MAIAADLHAWIPGSFAIPPTGSGSLRHRSVAIKDLFSIEGHISSFGHPRWRETHAPSTFTAPLVETLLAAGARVAGLTKLDQLAYSLVGNAGEGEPPINPLYPDRFPGGSSSGSASAVAGELADAGIGTDTAGSIRVPAAACGLYGLRPTLGLLNPAGVTPLAPSFDVAGVLAREPSTLSDVVRSLVNLPPVDLRQLRIPRDVVAELDHETAATFWEAARSIGDYLGCEVVECEFGSFVTAETADLFARLQAREIWVEHGSWVSGNWGSLAPDVRARLERAERLSRAPDTDKRADEAARLRYRRRYAQFAPAGTATLLPVTPGLPPPRDATSDDLAAFRAFAFRLAAPASLTGSPQLVLPAARALEGSPIPIGVLGMPGEDANLLTLATSSAVVNRELSV